jgi:hypothetical protein
MPFCYMEHGSIQDGVFAIGVNRPVTDLAQSWAWLRDRYERTGRDPGLIKSDILARAYARGLIHISFEQLVAFYAYREYVLECNAKIRVANDNDSDKEYAPVERSNLTSERKVKCRLKPIDGRRLPRVQWSPFRPIASVRVWSFQNLWDILTPVLRPDI